MDVYHVYRSELCYGSVDCEQCYHALYSQNCVNCRDGFFLKNCIGCHDCFGCINLRNASYCIYNEQYEPDAYAKMLEGFRLHTKSGLDTIKPTIRSFFLEHPHCFYQGAQNENVSGNYIFQGRNVFHCFDVNYMEDAKYCNGTRNMRDVYDVSYYGVDAQNELLYECEGVGHGVSNVIFSKLIWGGSSNCAYSYECFASHDLFGCAGLRHASFCILNTQYSQQDYEDLVPKIIERMRADGEWGEFFPISLTPFGYNEVAASEYFPMSREEALKGGWHWHDDEASSSQYMGPPYVIPDDIADVGDDILRTILLCEDTQKPYKVIPQELEFYRNMKIPVPTQCPDERYDKRITLRNPAKLWHRTCAKCTKDIQTTYAPERPEIVYCESCYLETVY